MERKQEGHCSSRYVKALECVQRRVTDCERAGRNVLQGATNDFGLV